MYCMTRHTIRNEREALVYMVECTLATIEDLAFRARPPKGELARQISIAQTGIDWVKTFINPGDRCGCARVQKIIDVGMTVEEFLKK